jgi:hypothetical protein
LPLSAERITLSGSFLRASKALKTFESMFFGGILARLRMLLTSALTNRLASLYIVEKFLLQLKQ